MLCKLLTCEHGKIQAAGAVLSGNRPDFYKKWAVRKLPEVIFQVFSYSPVPNKLEEATSCFRIFEDQISIYIDFSALKQYNLQHKLFF